MAKILNGGGVAEIRGSIAGTTFSRNRGGAYTRNRVSPVQPQTSFQLAQRARFTQLSKAWGGDLTQGQRDGWDAFALLFPVIDVFGLQTILTGEQMYVRINTRLLAGDRPRIDTAPVDQNVGELTTATVGVTVLPSLVMEITFTPTPLGSDDGMQILFAPPSPPGRNFIKNQIRLIKTDAGASVSPLDFTIEYVARFGAPVAGQKVAGLVRILRSTNGAISTPVRTDIIVA